MWSVVLIVFLMIDDFLFRMANGTNSSTCPKPMQATSNGAWQGDNPLDYALPLIILQICLVVVLTRGLAFLLKPLRQPRVIAEIIVSNPSLFPPSPDSVISLLVFYLDMVGQSQSILSNCN